MPDNRKRDLCKYRMDAAEETFEVAEECLKGAHYKDAINRSYYAVFYAVKAVLALEEKDFKRHKDVIAYFNQTYVAAGIFPKSLGRKLARLQQKREKAIMMTFILLQRMRQKNSWSTQRSCSKR